MHEAPAESCAPVAAQFDLAFRPPFDADQVFGFLRLRCVDGVEAFEHGRYRRVLSLPHGEAHVSLHPRHSHIACGLELTDGRDTEAAVQQCRRLLDLDADPVAISSVLSDDHLLAPLVRQRPGLRVPGHVDGNEVAVRAVLGQQVSVAGARTLAGRLVQAHGRRSTIPDPSGALSHRFPTSAELADAGPMAGGMPRSRALALHALVTALADGTVTIDDQQDRGELARRLTGVRGIGPWTASYIMMRALGDPDVFLPTDLGVRHALVRLGVEGDPRSATTLAEAWRPWRSYALMHLWASL